ncbi:efflux RND transporter periplasmic adaptor subunit [Hyphomicrobium sp. B1]|uniref:efflux RND transporter periplasmic adaptor subunit n=1 Tax=Hyphomicrobium sp. B1 TaxID=3075651 RepID=UPI003C2D3F9F
MSSPARTGCAWQNLRLFSRVAPILAVAATLALSGCGDRNTFIPPPPPKIELASPLKQTVTRYLMATGNTAAVNTTTLVARVQGFIQSIDYNDGDFVKAGKTLFVIEQQPYQLSLEQAQAGLASAEAQTKKSKADYERQVDLAAKNISSQATLDAATATYDAAVAAQKQSQVNIDQAQLNLSYTEVKAPFDGIVTAREVSLGQLVGAGSPTTLATIVQLQPIYVNFYVSESDVQSIRDNIRARAITAEELKKIPIEVGLQSETGYPHKGTLDYAAPTITANTGTLLVRGVFQNENKSLLPGYFVRVRVPRGKDNDALLVPDRVVGSDQAGRYVFVANKDDIIEQRKVVLGQQVGDLRVIETGLAPDDRVVISGLMTVVPGQKIQPVMKTISAPAPDADTAQ